MSGIVLNVFLYKTTKDKVMCLMYKTTKDNLICLVLFLLLKENLGHNSTHVMSFLKFVISAFCV